MEPQIPFRLLASTPDGCLDDDATKSLNMNRHTSKTIIYSQYLNQYIPAKYLFAITLSLLCCVITTRSQLMVGAVSNKDLDSKNQLEGDLDLYKITWSGTVHSAMLEYTLDLDVTDKGYYQIATRDNERYICLDPPINRMNGLNLDSSVRNSSSEKSKSPLQLLEPLLKGNSCSYKFDLFWIYELCHGRFLRQYHEENAKFKAKITQEYYLGRMDPEQIDLYKEEYHKEISELERSGQSKPTILVNGVYKPYVVVNMTMGTKCDITKKNRVSRIVYVCNEEPSLELYSIKEISTCEYEAIVLSPHLCQHKDFKIDTAVQHEIKCYALDSSPGQPKKIEEFYKEEEEDRPRPEKMGQKRRGVAYLQGRTLIIDADLLLS